MNIRRPGKLFSDYDYVGCRFGVMSIANHETPLKKQKFTVKDSQNFHFTYDNQ